MMVPRAFLFTSTMPPKTSRRSSENNYNTKNTRNDKTKSSMRTSLIQVHPLEKNPSSSPVDQLGSDNEKLVASEIHSSPVVIPTNKRGPRTTTTMANHQDHRARSRSRASRNPGQIHRSSSAATLSTPVASILEATAIPVPRRNRTTRDSRRIRGNHVEEFSKLLMEGVGSKDDRFMDGAAGSTALDVLLSPPDTEDRVENEKLAVGNDDDAESSLSGESTPSLTHDMESPGSMLLSSPSLNQKSPSYERRHLQLATPEDCATDHPLLQSDRSGDYSELTTLNATPNDLSLSNKDSTARSHSKPRIKAGFKSNLTASLRAIKSAAHTVSTFATPSVQPEDFLTRSLFTVAPELTDDRRPPPMSEPPSPALRRYLNPTPISPAEMHIYHESPRDPIDSPNKCPVSIQMQTYRRSDGRGRKKGSNSRKGFSPVDPEIVPVTSRQREPRENSNFLRVVVLEMNMRRSGKLRDDIPIRTRFWLPPRRGSASVSSTSGDYADEEGSAVPARWVGISADD